MTNYKYELPTGYGQSAASIAVILSIWLMAIIIYIFPTVKYEPLLMFIYFLPIFVLSLFTLLWLGRHNMKKIPVE